MRDLQNMIYHHLFMFSFLLFFVTLLVLPEFSNSVNTLSSTESLTISSNRTIVSPGGVFELGFFEFDFGSRWYLGIWYKSEDLKEYVWVANRDKPLPNSIGILKIVDSNLVLLDYSNTVVWSTKRTGDTRSPLVGELLDNGNFMLRESNNIKGDDEILWQSFDFPTDTLLPQMKLGLDRRTGLNKILRAWKSRTDPSSGNYSYELDYLGFPEFFSKYLGAPWHRSGPWDGTRFIGIQDKPVNYMVYNFTDNKEELAYRFTMINQSIYSRLVLNPSGFLDRYTMIPPVLRWNLIWTSPKDDCDVYKVCGPNGYCDLNTSPICNCIKGFDPENPQNWWELSFWKAGCARRTQLRCNEDGFEPLKKMKLPDTKKVVVDRRISTKECRERCLGNCNCTAFANTDIRNGGWGCVIWTDELLDMRNDAVDGQDLYVRLAASDLDKTGEERNKREKLIGSIIGVSVMLLLSFTIFYFWKRKQKLARDISASIAIISEENRTEDFKLPLMEFKAVAIATDNFSESNKLGQGGFGTVYKGRLFDGQEVAVKRLSKMSSQGILEFKNEVKLIAKLQHLNLVRLLAWCADAGENMLIYEYLENLSLDFYLFDKTQSYKLNWQMRFDIINGIARGILYLHQDSRLKIIHRDLKASNILLDKDMTPKISDFGMARIFGRDETEAYTRKVVGTYGYMSPEYAMDGIYSMKSDVFSFGVLLLEIISGKRNKGFYNSDRDLNLLACVWRNWNEGNGLEVVDPIILDSSSSSAPKTFRPKEILRCISIGLLCVQEHAHDRPTMSSVVGMLGSETAAIPHPEQPGYCVRRSPLGNDSSLSKESQSWTLNEITLSVVNGR